MKGIIFDVQRFSLHDGPGIRTTVFLKGCPLRCIWCHNPESMKLAPQSGYKKVFGREMSLEEVMAEVIKDQPYYENSGGGMTISGGEPMLQFSFTLELLKQAKELGVPTCIETCGYSDTEKYAQILPVTDLFLFDYKATGEDLHKTLTGVGQDVILSNLDFLAQNGARIILRCPLIPGVNDQIEHLQAISLLSQKYQNIEGVEILPYHDYAKGKWAEIEKENLLKEMPSASLENKDLWTKQLLEMGCLKLV